jgi:hypothetical protein
MPNRNRTGIRFDRVAATCAALVIMGLAVFLLVRNEPIASSQLFVTGISSPPRERLCSERYW